ncbi:MAG TPA: hypothetical protein VFH47_04535, partial [Candidatus Thermoplasmatota archaeon]|nr:hypothetical protein [Candidatus Thermoplasmatota archaeon]
MTARTQGQTEGAAAAQGPPHPPAGLAALEELERQLGIVSSYTDGTGAARTASLESRLAVLRAVGIDLDDVAKAPDALRRLRNEIAARPCSPVVVAWDGGAAAVRLRVPGTPDELSCRIVTEDGSEHAWAVPPPRG